MQPTEIVNQDDYSNWYEVVEGSELMQGDVLRRCPVPTLQFNDLDPVGGEEVSVEVRTFDVVVLSQSCDIENAKISDIVLAKVISWKDAVAEEMASGNSLVRSQKFREKIVAGDVPGLSLLHKREANPGLEWSVVSFHHLSVLSKAQLVDLAARSGPRLRLRPPYREHLAQAFARYFMRIGLPHDAKAFVKEGAL